MLSVLFEQIQIFLQFAEQKEEQTKKKSKVKKRKFFFVSALASNFFFRIFFFQKFFDVHHRNFLEHLVVCISFINHH